MRAFTRKDRDRRNPFGEEFVARRRRFFTLSKRKGLPHLSGSRPRDRRFCPDQARTPVSVLTDENFGQKHIAGHAAADPCQHAEERRHDRGEPEGERLLRAGNREETQPSGVEQEHRAAQPVDDEARQKVTIPASSETPR